MRNIIIVLCIILCVCNLLFIELIYFSYNWKNKENHLFKNKSVFEGPDTSKFNNLILNSLNQILSLCIKPQYDKPILSWKELYPQAKLLQDNWETIRKEALNIMDISHSYADIDDMNTDLANHDNKYWKTYVFKYYKGFNIKNCERCPFTAKLLKKLPEINLAMFSILEEGKQLYPHHGPWRGILRIHLGLVVPPSKPYINVGKKTYSWKEGEIVAFDDTYLHSVNNPIGGGPRIILFIDINRPDIPKFFHKITQLASNYFNKVNSEAEKASYSK